MGCRGSKTVRKRTETEPLSVDELKTKLLVEYKQIQKRFGHPTYYEYNGYDIGEMVIRLENICYIYDGKSRYNHSKVSIKERLMSGCSETDVIQEVLILSNLSHYSLPHLWEVFITQGSVFQVTNYIDRVRLSTTKDRLTVKDCTQVVSSLLEAAEYCHNKQIILRDLSPSNVCIKRTAEGTLRLLVADLSLAVVNGSRDYLCDSPHFHWSKVPFMAPEALLGDNYGVSMDLWCIGVVMYWLLAESLPFDSDIDSELMVQITSGSYTFPSNKKPFDAAAQHLVLHLLSVSADKRLSAREARKHQWFTTV